MANPRKFSEKIALHNQKQAEETAAFEKIMREVSDATNKADESTFTTQYGIGGNNRTDGLMSPSRSPGQRGRASSSVGPMRTRPAERKHDTSPYGSTVYLSPPPDSSWRRTNSDSALHQSCGDQIPTAQALSPHHPHHMLSHTHSHAHHNHRRTADNNFENVLAILGANTTNRPRSSCEMPRIPTNNSIYESGGGGGGGGVAGGGLMCGELQVPGGSLPDLTSVHFPAGPHTYGVLPHRTSQPNHYQQHQSPTSPGGGGVSPAGAGGMSPAGPGSVSPATGGLSPASGSPVGATVPSLCSANMDHSIHTSVHGEHHPPQYETQNHLSVPNSNNYHHQNKNMSPLDHSWMTSNYQTHCSPPSLHSSHSNINMPSPTMAHSPGSPAESPHSDYYLQQSLLQPFEQITMLDSPTTNYSTSYMNHSSPHSPQTTNTQHIYSQSPIRTSSGGMTSARDCRSEVGRVERDPVPGGNGPVFSASTLTALTSPTTPASIPDIILTDYSGELDAGIFGGEEAQLRAGLDLDDLTLLEEPSALLPDSSVEHEFRLDRL